MKAPKCYRTVTDWEVNELCHPEHRSGSSEGTQPQRTQRARRTPGSSKTQRHERGEIGGPRERLVSTFDDHRGAAEAGEGVDFICAHGTVAGAIGFGGQ